MFDSGYLQISHQKKYLKVLVNFDNTEFNHIKYSVFFPFHSELGHPRFRKDTDNIIVVKTMSQCKKYVADLISIVQYLQNPVIIMIYGKIWRCFRRTAAT